MPIINSLDDLHALKVKVEPIFADLHKEVREDEKYYNLDFREMLQIPAEFDREAVVLPTARTNVEVAVEHIDTTHRRVEVPAKNSSPEAQADARRRQRFYESLLNYIEDSHDQSPYSQGVTHLGGIGLETWKFIPIVGQGRPKQKSGESDSDYEERLELWKVDHATTMPFRLILLHPSEVLFDPWNPTPKWGIHSKKMLVGEAESIYTDWPNRKGRGLTHEVNVIEYWDDEYRAVSIDGQSGLKGGEVVRHRWGTHPFIVGASGYGSEDSDHRMERRYVSINRYLRDVLHSESRNYSVVDVVLKSEAWPVRTVTGDRANEVPNLEFKPGKLLRLPSGVTLDTVRPNLPPDMVLLHQSQAAGILRDATGGAAARGLRAPGTTSGIDQQTQLGTARLKFRPLATGVERMLQQVCVKAGIYMRTVINHPVSIASGARTDDYFDVTASMFKTPTPVRVRVNVLDPEDEVRKKNATAQELAAGTIDQLTAIEELHPDKDARLIQKRVYTDRLTFHPIIQQVVAGAVAEKLVQNLDLAAILEDATNRVLAAEEGAGQQTVTPPAETGGGTQAGSRSEAGQRRVQEGRATGL